MSGQKTQQRIILWSVPRSLSSAFYRAIMNGPNTKGLIEPYGEPYYWGTESTSDRYDKVDPECTFKGVKTMLEGPHTDCQTVFVKDMSFFPVQIFKDNVKDVLPNGYTHTFLIRNPKYSIPSFYKMSTDEKKTGWKYFDPKEVGFKESLQLFHEVKNVTGTTPTVVDANDLLENPEAVLRAYCESTNLDFCSSMINWEDNPYTTLHLPLWPEGWFTQLLSSKTFKKPVPKDDREEEFPDVVYKTIENNMKYYHELKKYCLAPAQN